MATTIITDWTVPVTLDRLLGRLEPGRRLPSPRVRAVGEKAMEIGASLLDPKSVHGDYAVESVSGRVVRLEGGFSFHSDHLARLVRDADRLVVMCRTIGPAVETTVSSLLDDDPALAYALDVYGTIAQTELGRVMYQRLSGRFPGWRATVPLAPGQLDWSVQDQAVVFELLSPERIGVTLSPSYMMTPVKSTTGVFGVGHPARLERGTSPCEICPRRDTCDFHRESREASGAG